MDSRKPPVTDEQVEAELSKTFDNHSPPPHVAEIHDAWRAMCKSFAANLLGLPPTRERAMALTRLEECGFWLQACIARNHDKFAETKEE
ncbi:MAG: hypothetical protein V3R87_02825 [Dehalococcoidia bacterium]